MTVGQDERGVVPTEHVAQLGHEPALMPGLDRHPHIAPEGLECPLESIEVDLEGRRKLKKDRPESIAQDRCALHQVVDRTLRVVEPLDVRQVSTGLYPEHEPVGHGMAPATERRRRRHPVEGHVELDRVEVLGEVREPIAALDEPRVERSAPVLVVEAGGPDEDGHAAQPRAQAAKSSLQAPSQWPDEPIPLVRPIHREVP